METRWLVGPGMGHRSILQITAKHQQRGGSSAHGALEGLEGDSSFCKLFLYFLPLFSILLVKNTRC